MLLLSSLVACAGNSNNKAKVEPVAEERPSVQAAINPKSKFAKISKGMSMKQVEDLIGPPTDSSDYTTGKAFIPFYFGNDTMRKIQLYKGEGQIVYVGGSGVSGGSALVDEILYDPKETGYNK